MLKFTVLRRPVLGHSQVDALRESYHLEFSVSFFFFSYDHLCFILNMVHPYGWIGFFCLEKNIGAALLAILQL